jgi:hypothetical protein
MADALHSAAAADDCHVDGCAPRERASPGAPQDAARLLDCKSPQKHVCHPQFDEVHSRAADTSSPFSLSDLHLRILAKGKVKPPKQSKQGSGLRKGSLLSRGSVICRVMIAPRAHLRGSYRASVDYCMSGRASTTAPGEESSGGVSNAVRSADPLPCNCTCTHICAGMPTGAKCRCLAGEHGCLAAECTQEATEYTQE